MIEFTNYLDIISKELVIRYYPNQSKRFCAQIDGCETTTPGSCMLTSEHGNERTPEGAINDYLRQLKGKTLVFNAAGNDRVEYKFPNNVVYDPHSISEE